MAPEPPSTIKWDLARVMATHSRWGESVCADMAWGFPARHVERMTTGRSEPCRASTVPTMIRDSGGPEEPPAEEPPAKLL